MSRLNYTSLTVSASSKFELTDVRVNQPVLKQRIIRLTHMDSTSNTDNLPPIAKRGTPSTPTKHKIHNNNKETSQMSYLFFLFLPNAFKLAL